MEYCTRLKFCLPVSFKMRQHAKWPIKVRIGKGKGQLNDGQVFGCENSCFLQL